MSGRAHLLPLASLISRVLPGRLGMPEALEADVQARGIHHHEHCRQPAMRVVDQPSLGAVETQ